MGGCTFSSDDIVIKSPNDKRLYRLIKLENGLTALLIHDPEIYPQGPKSLEPSQEAQEGKEDETAKGGNMEKEGALQKKKAAATMCVGVGSFSDPLEAQGLAHFLEHMLFMGSTKFPVENEYASYLSKHGGCSNAYTEKEHTCYYFDVKPEFLKGALERFSQFFISPLMKSEAMERELQAVDSEFNMVLQKDLTRLSQLQCHTSSPGHPFNKFSWGNKKSLDNAKEYGIDLRQQLLKLFEDYYHGCLMKLVVIGGECLDVLEQWVLKLFGDIKKGSQLNLKFKATGPIWKAGKVYRLEAVNDIQQLHLSWTLPCLHQHYLKSPEYYILYLLDHECRGGLHFYLKRRGWATSLGVWVDSSSVAYIFRMVIHLTDSGLEKIFEIIGFVYQYIKLLRQSLPQEWIFQELQNRGNTAFRFLQEHPQSVYANTLGENLLHYAAEHVIYGDYVYEIWDQELITYVLGFFRPENMRIDVISKSSTMSEDFQCEPWFGSQYTEEDVSPVLMDLWKDPPEIDASFHLREKNEFMPSDFSIRSEISCHNVTNTSYPTCVLDEPLLKFWYKLDHTFKVPRVSTYFRIHLKGGYDNLKYVLLSELYHNLLWDELDEIIYQASNALMPTSLYELNGCLELQFHGFNDKLPELLSKILTTIKKFLPTYDRFQVIKEDTERAYKNTNMNPLSHSAELREQVLLQTYHDVGEVLDVLRLLSVSDMKSFVPELWSQIYIEGFCHGNLLEEEAISLAKILETVFSLHPLPNELMHKNHCIRLAPGANLARDARVKNKFETNSALELYFQIEPEVGIESTRLRSLISLFDEIVGEPLFDQLRTKEQLGYVVGCYWNTTWRVFGFCFYVQSSEYNPIYLQDRVDNFINNLEEFLQDEDSFESHRSGLITKMLLKAQTLKQQSDDFWQHITNRRMFGLSERIVEELRSIQKEDVINFYKTYLQQPSPKCRRFAARVWGCKTDFSDAQDSRPELEQVIEDPATLKTSSEFYPYNLLNN